MNTFICDICISNRTYGGLPQFLSQSREVGIKEVQKYHARVTAQMFNLCVIILVFYNGHDDIRNELETDVTLIHE